MSSSLNNEIDEEDVSKEDRPEEISVVGSDRPREDSGPVGGGEVTVGYCAPYTGSICRKHLNGSVYYNFTSENHPIPINEQITNELWSELVSSLLEPCRLVFVFRLVCLELNLFVSPVIIMGRINVIGLPRELHNIG